MGYVAYNNKIDSTTTVASSAVSGTITDLSDIQKMTNRSTTDAYIFNNSAVGLKTFTFTLAAPENISTVAILSLNSSSYSISTITLFLGASDLGASLPSPQQSVRFIDDTLTTDEVYAFSQSYTADKIEIKYSDVGIGQNSIGTVYAGQRLDVYFTPLAPYQLKDTSKKDRSNGGQVYASAGVTYYNLKISTSPKLTHDECLGDGTINPSVQMINLISGTHSPVIIVPHTSQNMLVYGSQKTLATWKNVKAKETATKWWWEATFNIEGEL